MKFFGPWGWRLTRITLSLFPTPPGTAAGTGAGFTVEQSGAGQLTPAGESAILPEMNIDPRLIREALKERLPLLAAIACGLVGGVLAIVQARQLSTLISRVFLGGQALADVLPLFGGLLLIFALRALSVLGSEVSGSAAAARIKSRMREQLTEKLLRLGPAYTAGEQSGEISAVFQQGIDALDAYFSQYLPQLVLAVLVPLAVLVSVFPTDALSGAVLLVTAPLIPFFMILIGKASEVLTGRQFTALSRMGAYFLDTLQGLTTLKALGQSAARADRVEQVSERYRLTTMSVLRVTFLSALVLEMIGTLSTAIVAVQIGLRLLYGRMGFEQAFFILVIAPEFYLPLRQLGLRFHASMSGVSAAKRITQILEQPLPEVELPGAAPLVGMKLNSGDRLAFELVRFSYPDRPAPALNDVSFQIQPGKLNALVGPSGAGKTTAALLLLRFLAPSSGAVTLNGRDIRAFRLDDWRKLTAWVPQQPHLFHGSIGENIAFARPGAPTEEIHRAARLAQLEEFIDGLPLGYETPVGELGARLSGGQAQRIALARAFLKDAPLVVLDEPTAHLDPEQEALLEEATRRLCLERTVLIIAHRLTTVYRADHILVLDGSRLVESGTHAELLALDGRYAQMAAAWGGGA